MISTNPPTEKGFELGKKLFYDGRLASDGLVSCGFCHLQENAFTHHGHRKSWCDNALEPEMHLLFKIWLFNVLLCMMVPCPI
jgi:cytochrome c peroxidase